jgi:hypothetical protein
MSLSLTSLLIDSLLLKLAKEFLISYDNYEKISEYRTIPRSVARSPRKGERKASMNATSSHGGTPGTEYNIKVNIKKQRNTQ